MKKRPKFDFRGWRQRQGLTQVQAAAVLGISRTHQQGLEHGRTNPSRTLIKLARLWVLTQKMKSQLERQGTDMQTP